MNPIPKLITGWLIGSLFMFGISCVWHGVILNDFSRLDYPFNVFLLLASIVYLGIGFINSLLISMLSTPPHALGKSLLMGTVFGIGIYLIAFIFGLSFAGQLQWQHVALDVTWQAVEQGSGAVVTYGLLQFIGFLRKRFGLAE